jgi:hypothetical protein
MVEMMILRNVSMLTLSEPLQNQEKPRSEIAWYISK